MRLAPLPLLGLLALAPLGCDALLGIHDMSGEGLGGRAPSGGGGGSAPMNGGGGSGPVGPGGGGSSEGGGPPAPGSILWARSFGTVGTEEVQGFAVGEEGEVVIAGDLGGTRTFAGGSVSGGSFLIVYDQDGKERWGKGFDFLDNLRVAIMQDGTILLAGNHVASTVVGDPLPSTGVFVAAFDADGEFLWNHDTPIGAGTTKSMLTGLAVHEGKVVITGSYTAAANFGGGSFDPMGDTYGFLAYSDGADEGDPIWDEHYGADGCEVSPKGVAFVGDGGIAFTGTKGGPVSFGGGEIAEDGMFLVGLTPDTHKWSFDSAYVTAVPHSIAGTEAGTFSVSGTMLTPISFDNHPNIEGDSFLVVFDDQGISQFFLGMDGVSSPSFTSDENENHFLTGSFSSTIDLGQGALGTNGGSDIVVGRVMKKGFSAEFAWTTSFGSASPDAPIAIGTDALGYPVVVGHYTADMDVGSEKLVASPGGTVDIFIVKLVP